MPDEKFELLLDRHQEIDRGLQSVLAVLNTREPLNAVLDYITASASRLFGAEAVSIYRLDAEAKLLTLWATRGLGEAYVAHFTLPVGQTATGQAYLENKPVGVPDLRDVDETEIGTLDPKVAAGFRILAERYGAVLSVPLNNQQEKFGVMTFYYVQPREFSPEEIGLAVSFCDKSAQAIEETQRLAKIQEDAVAAERNRIARDLHDSVTQTLFSASLIAEVLPAVWKRDAADAGQSLEELRHLTRAALAEMRTLLLELRPVGLTEGRLEDLLKQLTEGVSGRLRAPLEVHMEGSAVLPAEVKLVFYRIAQETLNNLAKHSNAERGEVRLTSLPPRKSRKKSSVSPLPYSPSVRLLIRDNGCGFDPRTVTSEHMGLAIMQERALSVQAALTIRSKPGEGTEVSLVWPATEGKERP